MHQIAQMIGTNKISEALKMVEEYFGEVSREKYSGQVLEQSINVLIDEILHIYRNILQEETELLRFRNIFRFSQKNELMEELTGWMISFHEKLDSLNMAVVSNHISMNYSFFSYASHLKKSVGFPPRNTGKICCFNSTCYIYNKRYFSIVFSYGVYYNYQGTC